MNEQHRPPPGWYPDPFGGPQQRWWDGQRWVGIDPPGSTTDPAATAESSAMPADAGDSPASATSRLPAVTPVGGQQLDWSQDPATEEVPASWSRERRVAAGVFGALLLAGIGIWIAALVATGPDSSAELATRGETDQDAAAPTEPEASTNGGIEAPGITDDPVVDSPEQDGEVAGESDPGGTTIVELDGRCEVEVPEGTQPEELRAWELPECEHAPVELTAGEGRWIVVLASLNPDAHNEQSARQRSEDAGQRLLWSSHYPSLTPNLWVVFDGPFDDEDEARAAADDHGGGAYTRLLTAER